MTGAKPGIGRRPARRPLEEEGVFRPSAWGNRGAADPEGADFRACENFGPLYGRR